MSSSENQQNQETAAAVVAPRQGPRRRLLKSRRRIIGLIAVALVVILAAWLFLLPKDTTTVLQSSDYRVLETKDVVNKVPVNGTVEPERKVTLFTRLTGVVEAVHVKVGDRVSPQQVVVNIDPSSAQRELDSQLAQQAASDVTNFGQIEQAETQYRQFKDALDQGLNPQLNAAEAALRTATSQYDEAVINFEQKRGDTAAGKEPQVVQQNNAVTAARSQAISAAIDAAKAGVDVLGGSPTSPGEGQQTGNGIDAQGINTKLSALDSINRLNNASEGLKQSQEALENTLGRVDQELLTLQRAAAQAFEGKKEAAVALVGTQLATDQQLETFTNSVDQAWRSAQASKNAAEQGTKQLRVDIAAKDVQVPFGGVITSVNTEQGRAAEGALLTVADDERLIVRTEVKEVDLAKITEGAQVVFTTPGTGNTEYRGTVKFISSVAATEPNAPAEAKGTGSKKVSFPVEIEVTGKKEGLRIGASTKAQILIAQEANTLAVSREAVFDNDDGKKAVLALTNESSGFYEVVERNIEPGVSNDMEVSVKSGELKRGDIVINQANKYRNLVGQQVRIEDVASHE